MENDFQTKLDLIKNQVNIVDVIGHYLPLIHKGNNFWVVCPFHEDSNPSMSVSQSKQIYKCFTCQNNGNVFIFVQRFKNISFIKALQEVAKIAKIDLRKYQLNLQEKEQDPLKQANNLALMFFQYQLSTKPGKEAMEYFHNRGLTEAIIKAFGLGYAPEDETLISYLISHNITKENIVLSGLAKVNSDNQLTNTFHNRLMFPIFDKHGDCLGFSGRTFKSGATKQYKYVNTEETRIFKKGQLLYNLNNAKNAIINKKTPIYLVEGYMDAIALFKLGYKNTVATMGTTLTNQQLASIESLTSYVVLFLDGDIAGKQACLKMAATLLSRGLRVLIIDNKTENDPDELVKSNPEIVIKLLQETEHPIAFAIKTFIKQFNLKKDSEQVKGFLSELKPIWSCYSDSVTHNFYLNELTKITNLSVEAINSILNTKLLTTKPKKEIILPKKAIIFQKLLEIQKQLLFLVLKLRDVYLFLEKEKFIFIDNRLLNLYFLVTDKYKENPQQTSINIPSLLEEMKTNDIYSFLELLVYKYENKDFEINDTLLSEYLTKINHYQIETEIILLQQQLAQTTNQEEQIILLKTMSNLKKQHQK